MSKEPRIVFLEPTSYRRRRARDASRLLPVLGLVLMLFPGFWPETAEGGLVLSRAIVFLFCVWIMLIAIAIFLSRRLEDPSPGDDADGAQ